MGKSGAGGKNSWPEIGESHQSMKRHSHSSSLMNVDPHKTCRQQHLVSGWCFGALPEHNAKAWNEGAILTIDSLSNARAISHRKG